MWPPAPPSTNIGQGTKELALKESEAWFNANSQTIQVLSYEQIPSRRRINLPIFSCRVDESWTSEGIEVY